MNPVLQVAGIVVLVVIPSEARDLLFLESMKKQIPRANPALGMTILEHFPGPV
jgi:hypothetical protein